MKLSECKLFDENSMHIKQSEYFGLPVTHDPIGPILGDAESHPSPKRV